MIRAISSTPYPYQTNNNIHDQNAYYPFGMPVLDQGLVHQYANNGIGLLTKGLVWQAYDIWGPNGDEKITTSWTADPSSSITTTWTSDSSSSITTTWTLDNSMDLPQHQ
jgi:hypothetical protein